MKVLYISVAAVVPASEHKVPRARRMLAHVCDEVRAANPCRQCHRINGRTTALAM